MEILIGREDGTDHLLMVVDGKAYRDSAKTLPNTVSRVKPKEHTAHCKVTIGDDGKMTVTNMNPNNVTYVDGKTVDHTMSIGERSIIAMGDDLYRLSITNLFKLVKYTPPVSIKHLKKVWILYDKGLLNLQLEQQKKQRQQRLQGILSQLGMLCVVIPSVIPQVPIPAVVRAVLIVGALGMSIYLFMKDSRPDESSVIKKRELDEQLREDFVCPKCGNFLGNQPFDSVMAKGACPYCKARWNNNH